MYFFEDSANERTARELYALTDEQLENIGVSREKLEQGAAAFPWKVEQNEVPTSATVHQHDFKKEQPTDDKHPPIAA